MKRLTLLILAFFLLCTSSAQAAITVVQSSRIANGAQHSNSDGAVITGTTIGNGLIFLIVTESGVDPGTYTISGETVVEIGSVFTYTTSCCGTRGSQIVFVKTLASGGTKTLLSTADALWHVYAVEVSGHDTADFYDSGIACTNSGTSTAYSCSLTPSVNNAMVVAVGAGEIDMDATGGSGYTAIYTTGNNDAQAIYDDDVGAAGSKTPSMTPTAGSTAFGIVAAAFKPSGGGGGTGAVGPVNRRRTQ